MNANELRIGNLLLDRGSKLLRLDFWDFGKPAQRMFLADVERHPMTEDIEHCQPIQLTEDWLLKFGFEEDKNRLYTTMKGESQWYINGIDGCIFFSDVLEFDCVPNTKIKYVHQLQNLYFALTNEELTYTP
jgi:hypothetical protein